MAMAAAPQPKKPRLTVEAFAELINSPGYEQLRILHDQKYPTQVPAAFRAPYYNDAMTAIRRYHQQGNDLDVITQAIIEIQSVEPNAKTRNNVRVLEAFRDSAVKDRTLTLQKLPRLTMHFGTVEVRFTPDLYGQDGDRQRFIVFNPRLRDANDEIARMTLELAYQIALHRKHACEVGDFEYVNLISNQVVKTSTVRKRTITRAKETAQVVAALWDTI